MSSNQRRIYRLAVAATGEYTAYFGGQVSVALAQIVTAINRVNQIYGRDLGIQFQLVGNNDRIIYSSSESDPYTQSASSIPTMLEENQQNLDYILGADNYDIGHLFGVVGGGLASVSSACQEFKAQGYTGTPEPDNDVFYIDFVAHELGHQLSATHSFNGTAVNCGGINRDPEMAMEPGSGSTIMSYAGICGEENLQSNSNATFHAISIQQIHAFITRGGGSQCGSLVSTTNHAPIVDAGATGEDAIYTIPAGTPFRLTGQASDQDGDTLSYQWDEMDAGGDSGATDASTIGTDIQANPLFRSFLPKTTPERYFPRLSLLITGSSDIGETLPEVVRELNFRLTVRDGESGVAYDDLIISVNDKLGSFKVTGGSLNSGGSFSGGTRQSLNWSVAATDSICPEVEISLLSLSKGDSPVSYCDHWEAGLDKLNLGRFANSGSALIELPDISLQRGRVMLACANGPFFDLSDRSLQIEGQAVMASDCKPMDGETLEHGSLFTDAGSATKFDSPGGGGGGALGWLNLLLGGVLMMNYYSRKKLATCDKPIM
ncbi:MAG: M12 family metallo-peptidase [Candidatus Thiodiazotropha sp.]